MKTHALAGMLVVTAIVVLSSVRAPLAAEGDFAIAIHGGAGTVPSSDDWREHRAKVLREALTVGRTMLDHGDVSLDVVEQVIRILEDSPYFNAGKGAVFNAAGAHELDASIMDGRTRACGAVGAVRTIRNPISMARIVMTDTRHILLISDGAERFADDHRNNPNVTVVDNSYFSTAYRRSQLERVQSQQQTSSDDSLGTVGCVALDRHGNLAAGTSTGGLTNKKHGRIGDSSIIGAGTFADNQTCAVSCTGIGEDFMRNAVAYDVSARMAYAGESVERAVQSILRDSQRQVRGGIIAVDAQGRCTMQFNTAGMARAVADSNGRFEIHVAE